MATSSGGPSSSTNWDLHFLIAKFLSVGPCQEAAKVLIKELEKNEIIPKRTNWLGHSISQDFQTFDGKHDHIKSDHLLKLLEKLLENAKIETPSGSTVTSILSATVLYKTTLTNRIASLGHPRRHILSLPSSSSRKRDALLRREIFGVPLTHKVNDSDFFSKLNLQCSSLGHLTAVYCVLFDITGKFIFTGADDHLVKVWSAIDGRLLTSLRGNSAQITDLAVNKENTLLASSSCDRYIRIWCLATGAPVAALSGHTSNVTSIFFCPMPRSRSRIRYLASTSTDGSCAFWAYLEEPGKQAEFQSKPTLYLERMRPGHAQMICSSFSPGGIFMAAGSADNNVRVYHMLETEGPKRILEVQPHTERVDSISWAHRGVRFISGSKDGTALVWRYDFGDNWRFTKINSWKPAPGDPPIVDPKLRPRVTMVGWNADDSLVLTAVSNHLVKVWNPDNGQLVRVLRDHNDEVYVIEPHPIYPSVVCTAGHDGQIFVWDIGLPSNPDINSGRKVFEHKNVLEEAQGHGAVFDVKWSPDGLSLAATDSHGHILIFSCTSNDKFSYLPKELFFHTDYRPLSTDAITNTVLDEQTQVLPHLMPPPFLVNMDGAPYPAQLQRLVPGRENCKEEQLIPNVALAPGGQAEVIEGIPAPPGIGHNARSNIDEMIAQLAAEQGVHVEQGHGMERRESDVQPNERRGIAHRRSGDIEGVRQSRGNWQRGGFYEKGKRTIIQRLSPALLARSEEIRYANGEEEETHYQERKTKKLHSPVAGTSAATLCVSPADSTSSQDIRSRRLRRLAAQAAERRREEEQQRINEEEGIPRPNPPQQEISLPQFIPRNRNSDRSRGTFQQRVSGGVQVRRRGGGTSGARRTGVRRALRFSVRPDNNSDAEVNGHSSAADSSFSSSDVSETSSSESEFTDSDWGGKGTGATPTKASTSSPKKNNVTSTANEAKKRTTRKMSGSSKENEVNGSDNNSDEDYEDPRPGPSSQIGKTIKQEVKSRPSRQKRKVLDESQLLDGISPACRPSEWFATQKPCNFPYWPQIGDELIYLRQGHEKYINTVLSSKVYDITKKTLKSLTWNANPDLEAQVTCRVTSVKFELKPPRLVSLKLAVVDGDSGELTGTNIHVTYHDIKDVVDFLILRQLYDKSMRHNWNVNDRFRCLIQNVWWLGTIITVQPYSTDFPNSKFLLYKVRWDNNDLEVLSPWDIEVVPDAFEIPEDSRDNGIFATDEDVRADLYQVTSRDWPPYGHQDAECDRISAAIGEVMSLGIAEPFLTPVDLNQWSDYAYAIAYPMDLSTIKARLDNRFYRRLDAIKFDIKFIAINTETYNVSKSDIVKKSRIIRDLCLRICSESNTDVTAEYHSLQDGFAWLSTDIDEEERRKKVRHKTNAATSEANVATSSSRCSTRLRERETKPKLRRGRGAPKEEEEDDESSRPWDERCKDLLNKLWHCRDAAPFREPVDPVEYPNYHQQIDTPMDLQSIKEDLLGGNYATPLQFSKDVQLIFSNSKQFNTDKHSAIHLMTLRLKALFDCQIRPILEDWKRNKSKPMRGLKSTRKEGGSSVGGSPTKVATSSRPSTRLGTSGNSRVNGRYKNGVTSPRKNPTRSAASRNPYILKEPSSAEEEEEEEEEEPIADSSSEEEFVADEENYRDKRKRRHRKSEAQKSESPGPRPSTSRAAPKKKSRRGKARRVTENPVVKREPSSAEEEEEEAEASSNEMTEEEQSRVKGRPTKKQQNRKTRVRDRQEATVGSSKPRTTTATRTSTRRNSLVSKENGRCNGDVIPSPRKNPTRSAATRNPYVNNHPSSHDEEANLSSEEEFVPVTEEETYERRGTKRRQSEALSTVSTFSQSSTSPLRRRGGRGRRVSNGYRLGTETPSPEAPVRRSTRIPSTKRRRFFSSDDEDTEQERGPNTRFRGRSSKNYEEGVSNSSYEDES